MKIQIEIDDFYLDQESELEPALKSYIIDEVVLKINKEIEDKVNETVTRQVKLQVKKQMLSKTNKLIDEFIEKGKIKGDYATDPEITVEQYIKKIFNCKNGWGNPSEQISKLAEKFGAELRNRYDLLFATQIVKKLDKEGFLKDNIAKMLLETNS